MLGFPGRPWSERALGDLLRERPRREELGDMAGTRRSSWEWLVTGSKGSAREEKPLEYAVQLTFPLLTLIHPSA